MENALMKSGYEGIMEPTVPGLFSASDLPGSQQENFF